MHPLEELHKAPAEKLFDQFPAAETLPEAMRTGTMPPGVFDSSFYYACRSVEFMNKPVAVALSTGTELCANCDLNKKEKSIIEGDESGIAVSVARSSAELRHRLTQMDKIVASGNGPYRRK